MVKRGIYDRIQCQYGPFSVRNTIANNPKKPTHQFGKKRIITCLIKIVDIAYERQGAGNVIYDTMDTAKPRIAMIMLPILSLITP